MGTASFRAELQNTMQRTTTVQTGELVLGKEKFEIIIQANKNAENKAVRDA
jgi:hypothetical protein